MGCSFSREEKIKNEENIIKSAENSLGFQTLDCSEFDMSFSRYAGGNYLSVSQLKASLEALGLI